MNGKALFQQDLNTLLSKLTVGESEETRKSLVILKDWLVKLQRDNVVKINHSVMELVCAKYLILKDYEVQLEYPVNDILTCDLYSTKGYGNLIVEIETGFIPPDHALDPLTYTQARLASKIIRYSSFAGKFALGVPPHYILPFPSALALPPKRRTQTEIENIKKLCDRYYENPPVTEEEIREARIHEIYVINVDQAKVKEMDPEEYMKRVITKGLMAFEEPDTETKTLKTLDNFMENEPSDEPAE
jgi:hypothetical protein